MAEGGAAGVFDSRVPHESTGVHGRGTEEVKTNDVSGRVGPGEAGFTIEFATGRGCVVPRYPEDVVKRWRGRAWRLRRRIRLRRR